jgi:opacity protein-like surface antigen
MFTPAGGSSLAAREARSINRKGNLMKKFLNSPLRALLLAVCALTASQSAWAYDSAIKVGVGLYTLDYQDQSRSASGNSGGFALSYVGRFNPVFGFDVRIGGAGTVSSAGLSLKPGAFLSMLFRPSIPFGESGDLYGLVGITSLAVGRTPANGHEEIIARVGPSVGLGAEFRITQHMLIGAEWVSYQRDVNYGPNGSSSWSGVTQANVSLSALTASFKYQF